MNGTVAVTDFGWYEYLTSRQPAEVNWLAWDCFGEGNGCGSLVELTTGTIVR